MQRTCEFKTANTNLPANYSRPGFKTTAAGMAVVGKLDESQNLLVGSSLYFPWVAVSIAACWG